jgi:hypothetical protein
VITRNSPQPVTRDQVQDEWRVASVEFKALADRLTAAHPLVIDYFLDHNPDLEAVGKFCIAWALLHAESNFRQHHQQNLNPENWIRFILHRLTTGVTELLANRVHFVTFNYDVSLEYELARGLFALKRFSEDDTVADFLNGRITHVYGRIRRDAYLTVPRFEFGIIPPGQDKSPEYWQKTTERLDEIFDASSGLNVISPGKATDIPPEIYGLRTIISDAACVYILGYGFDRLNSELLDLGNHLQLMQTGKIVFFTNYENHGVINKNVARLVGISANELLPEGGLATDIGAGRLEKSVRKVYDALARDFDSPEDDDF